MTEIQTEALRSGMRLAGPIRTGRLGAVKSTAVRRKAPVGGSHKGRQAW